MSAGKIGIYLQDSLCAQVLQEQCSRSFSHEIVPISKLDAASCAGLELVVCDKAPQAKLGIPVVVLADRPQRMTMILEEITSSLKQLQARFALRAGVEVDTRQRVLIAKGQSVELTDKEAAILQQLYQAEGQCLTQDALLKNVWDYDSSLDTHTLQTHIYRLRNKLKEAGLPDSTISAEDGGYCLQLG